MRPVFVTILCVAALTGFASGARSQAPAAPKRYAVVVGVNEYAHRTLAPLKYAVNDATELAAALRDHYDVTLLTDATDAKPTKANIEAALKRVLDGCPKGSTVLVAFAGHGVQFEGVADSFLCPSDARPLPDRRDTLVSLAGVYARLDDCFARVKVVMVDVSREAPVASRSLGRGAAGGPRPPQGVAAVFSCSPGERAFEHDRLKHGVFFHHVICGLTGEARNKRGEVTLVSLIEYVFDAVAKQVPDLIGDGARQTPTLRCDMGDLRAVLVPAPK